MNKLVEDIQGHSNSEQTSGRHTGVILIVNKLVGHSNSEQTSGRHTRVILIVNKLVEDIQGSF